MMSTSSRGDAVGVLLLDELGEDAFEIGELQGGLQLGGWGVGEDLSFGDDDDAIADQLDDFEDVRDVEDCLALRGELLQQIFEETGGDDVEAGERLVEDEQLGIVQQGGGDEDALLHALGVERDGRVAPGFEAEQGEEPVGLEVDEGLGQVAQAADELEVLEAGEVGVDVGLLGDVAEGGAVGLEIVADALAFEEHLAVGGLEEAGDDLDGGGFAGAVGTDVADDLAGTEAKADVVDGGKATIAFGESFDLEHGNLHPLCSIHNRASQVACYIDSIEQPIELSHTAAMILRRSAWATSTASV